MKHSDSPLLPFMGEMPHRGRGGGKFLLLLNKKGILMKTKITTTLFLLTVLFISCKTTEKTALPPHEDEKIIHSGIAVITKISESKTGSDNDTIGYFDIYFNFIPSKPHAADNYLCKECPDTGIKLFYDNRGSFHTNWVKKWDIKPGNTYPAIRHELHRKDDRPSVSHEVFLDPAK